MIAQRRLAAILAADVVGYSRLMELDEAGTLAALKARRKSVLEPLVAKHQGRVFKIAGDGVLVEFASAVNAVQCAIDLQAGFGAANAEWPEDRRIVLRIGVHVGDVMVEGSDLYGDGVNIAARLESIAEPGGIVVSEDAHRQIRNKVDAAFEDIGPRTLKNMSEPLRAYRSAKAATVAEPPSDGTAASTKPTVAILPFTSMSGDPEFKNFSDGLCEDIITELSRFKSLAVVARNTSFQFGGKPIDIAEIGRRLGVRYVVEGSVRRIGERVRVTAQLIDAGTNKHLWAERFDHDANDLFSAQDNVVKTVVASIADQVDVAEVLHRSRKPTQNWSAYDYLLRAREGLAYGESWLPQEEDLRRAIALDPTIAEARSLLVYVLVEKYALGGQKRHLEEALEMARSALSLNPNGSGPHVTMAYISQFIGRPELASDHIDRAIKLNPNNHNALIFRALWLTYCGRCEEAAEALSAEPSAGPSILSFHREVRAVALFQLRRYREVIDILTRSVKPDVLLWAHAVSALAHIGNLEEAHRQVAEFLAKWPGTTIRGTARWVPYQLPDLRDHLLDGLRKAGLPE